MKNRVIAFKNLPSRPPIVLTAVTWLLLDRFKAPGWMFGAAGVVMLLLSVAVVVGCSTEEKVDIFKDGQK